MKKHISLFLIAFLNSIMAVAEIQKGEFLVIKAISEIVLQKCPPETCRAIGIGRSPTPFLAYLELEQPGYARQLPLSDFKYGVGVGIGSQNLTDEETAVLFKHFEKYLPLEEMTDGKSILLFDFTVRGLSIVAAQRHICAYFNKSGVVIPIQTLAYATAKYFFPLDQIHPDVGTLISISGGIVTEKIHYQRYDDYAQFGQFDISSPENALQQQNPKYSQLLEEMRVAKMTFEQNLGDEKHGVIDLLDIEGIKVKIENSREPPKSLHGLSHDEKLRVKNKLVWLSNTQLFEDLVLEALADPSENLRADFLADTLFSKNRYEGRIRIFEEALGEHQPTSVKLAAAKLVVAPYMFKIFDLEFQLKVIKLIANSPDTHFHQAFIREIESYKKYQHSSEVFRQKAAHFFNQIKQTPFLYLSMNAHFAFSPYL